ncbi:hypothetical protein Aspvir_009666 [Aspergillus viridinutans]|uniref:Uncharacterized protein n=1 Tax=Aspergillus viridinutans TaxID=75553 RepID=A0A9P3C3I4_ASPVI|nr:uncharacterized protein Aspvir_009666 [Aspergillus viridinutans]GIK05553.1 hypothetical protein Aspvir_009666 [Aspergillus viridinutans]
MDTVYLHQPLRTAVAVSFGVGLLYWVYRLILQKTKSLKALDLPVLQSVGDQGIVKALEEGHAKYQYPDSPFALGVPGQQVVVVPVSEIDTVKALPENQLSIKKHHYNQFLGEYSYMGTKADEFDDAMRYVLVRNTPAVLASFTAEIDYAMLTVLQLPPNTWTRVKPRSIMPKVATILSGRAFVGLPLSREPDWIESNVNYTQDVSRAWMVLRFYPHWIRPLVAPFLRDVKTLEKNKALIGRKIAKLLADQEAQKLSPAKEKIPGGDMIDWFKSRYQAQGKTATAQQLTRDQLLATFASIYNLSNALTYVIFDLAAYPAVVDELREELDQVLGPNVGAESIDKTTLPRLIKMDSFVRESQRLSPTSLVNIPRIVTDPNGLRLKTGHVIPPGYLVMGGANENRWQHTSTGADNINFGHGLWACPGRFFASAEIKVVVAYVIRHYDLRLVEGRPRPTPKYGGLAIFPDAEAEVEFRPRL